MATTDRCVVRNQPYQRSSLSIRERHNERKNESYGNGDIDLSRAHLNVHFKQCEGTYTEAFDKLVANDVISLRGLKQNAKIVDEMVFDVNTEYFERNGGYEYAKDFFAEAYQMAVKEAGDEEYILSAVMHADERNKKLSEELGRDIYHYHLHVVYVPVVDKEIRWSKRCKNPNLVGTVKETIKQVSHSKKWGYEKITDENGKICKVNTYSLLQDRFYSHMKTAGYTDFERGERGSTAEHLSVLDYKIEQESRRLGLLDDEVQSKEKRAAMLDNRVERLENRLAVVNKANADWDEIQQMVKKNLLGKLEISPADWEMVRTLSREGLSSRAIIQKLKDKGNAAVKDKEIYKIRWESLFSKTKDYLEAEKRNPEEMRQAVDALRNTQPNQLETEHKPIQKNKLER